MPSDALDPNTPAVPAELMRLESPHQVGSDQRAATSLPNPFGTPGGGLSQAAVDARVRAVGDPAYAPAASVASALGVRIPNRALDAWQQARAAALAGTGFAGLDLTGHSYVSGQCGGTSKDRTIYGYPGRLKAILMAAGLPLAAEGSTPLALPDNTAPNTTSPYSGTNGSVSQTDGGLGIGQMGFSGANGAAHRTITVPLDPNGSGAGAISIDLLYVDMGQAFSYTVDGAAQVQVAAIGGAGAGAGTVRRLTIPLTGNTAHTITYGYNTVGSSWLFAGHVVTYRSAGFGLFRNSSPGYSSMDVAGAGGASASASGGLVTNPDRFLPYAGLTQTGNAMGTGFPVGAAAWVLDWMANDGGYGVNLTAIRRSYDRQIRARRRARPGSLGILLTAPVPGQYSDAPTLWGMTKYAEKYRDLVFELGAKYGCVVIDLAELFGEIPLTEGLFAAGNIHPTHQAGAATFTHAAATTNGQAFVADTSVLGRHRGFPVSGTGIPANSFVGKVQPGVGFTLSSSDVAQVDVAATATGTPTLTLAGDGHLVIARAIADVVIA